MVDRQPALVALGETIRTVRRQKGFSQENFAYSAGLDRAYYGAIERGERNVSALNLMRIAATLQVEVGELFPRVVVLGPLLSSSGEAETE